MNIHLQPHCGVPSPSFGYPAYGPQGPGMPFTPPSPLGAARPGIGQIMGGLVGAVLGQIMMPIPFMGAMMGAMIGASLGAMLDQMFGGFHGCCHNMGQHYGPHNAQQSFGYGYPMPLPFHPQGFHNPPYGSYPPLYQPYPNEIYRPGRPPQAAEFLSNLAVKPGGQAQVQVVNRDNGVAVNSQMVNHENGSTNLVQVANPSNPNTELSRTIEVPQGGIIEQEVRQTPQGVATETVATNRDLTAVSHEQIVARPDSTHVRVEDIDGVANTQLLANSETVRITNPGTTQGGNVVAEYDISEASRNGPVENFARGVNDWVGGLFGNGPQPSPTVELNGLQNAEVHTGPQGQVVVSGTRPDGTTTQVQVSAGDTDDSLLERAGATVDTGIRVVGDAVQTGVQVVGDTIQTGVQVVGDAVNTGVQVVGSAIDTGVQAVGSAVDTGLTVAGDMIGGAWSGITGFFGRR